MSIIGDLVFLLRGDPKQLNVDVKKAGDQAGDSFGKRMAAGFKKSWSGQNIGKGLVQGLGLAGGLGAVNLLTGGIGKMVDVLGDATKAAIADEESQARLAQSLRANVPAWDGQTDAIEANIKAKQRLGFDDETLRDSLSVLVGATNDVTEAQRIQNIAMDLARFKRIDLKTASEALIKVEGGAYRSLKQLGIKLKDNATSTEALAAVQAVAAGQAEAYAETNAGKLAASQIAVDEAMEHFGAITMPIVVEGVTLAADAVENLVAAFDVVAGKTKAATPEIEQLAFVINLATKGIEIETFAFRKLIEIWQTAIGVVGNVVNALTFWDNAQGQVADGSTEMAEAIKGAANGVGGSFEEMEEDAKDWRDAFRDVSGDIIRRSNRMRAELVKDAALVRGEVFDETEIRAELHDQRLGLLALRERARDAKTAGAKRQATDDIIQALDDQGASLEDLAGIGKLTSKDVDRFEADVKKSYKSLSKEGRDQIDALIRKYRALAAMKNIKKTFTIVTRQGSGTHPGGGGPQERASGGPVTAGLPYIVGERRSEIFVPNVSGRIIPHVTSATMQAAGMGGTMINNIQLPVSARPDPFEVATQLRRLNDFGILGGPP